MYLGRGCVRGDACRRVTTGDIEGPFSRMWIGAVLHPAVRLAFADGASFMEHVNRPSAHRPYRRSSFSCHQHGNTPDTANRFVRDSFRLLTHGWDSQWREIKVWSVTALELSVTGYAPSEWPTDGGICHRELARAGGDELKKRFPMLPIII
jgi:hypothetical protein